MTFTNRTLAIIIVYVVCFIVAAVGNLTVFLTLWRGRYRKSRISLMICHLSIADLLVAFFTIPIEVSHCLVELVSTDINNKWYIIVERFIILALFMTYILVYDKDYIH